MISAFVNIFKIPDLRQRILFTLAMIVIVRIGYAITLPGVNPHVLQAWVDLTAKEATNNPFAAAAALVNVFSGGGLQRCAIFALGIMPYISASIMMQLLTAVVPSMSKLSREDGGRQKINQWTRYATVGLCLLQGYMLAVSLKNPGQNIFLSGLDKAMQAVGSPLVPDHNWMFVVTAVLTMTAGSMFIMWMGEQITERGIGNGVSLLICINIVSDLPGALVRVWKTFIANEQATTMDAMKLLAMLVLLVAVIAGIIALTQAQRRIAIQYAKRVVGRKVYGGQTQYMPLKVNYAGVMPIIFAQAILLFPAQIIGFMFPHQAAVQQWAEWLAYGWPNLIISTTLIFFFSYFWVATMFQPNQIAEDLKKSGGYIPGQRPGKPTADFLDFTMSRLTFAGALFLTLIYLLPLLVQRGMKIDQTVAQFFGGTSILILVGVVLDVMRQVETHLLQRHYDGFLRKGKIRGRFERQTGGGIAANPKLVVMLWTVIAIIALVGVSFAVFHGK
ncbi:preprotein translocase subunit SecY [Roseimicrobium sp. ORNL1]|uniref:preprotein translocase subunit SecY n=1 Tax=Roseimicrobium sp. ORNL1 TaxID=2711231 RepID=UPI0013E1486F|nr:preprotein translocase subunit SecY [Roseimicrobium sp. ORNL1]QIF01191.1 preprotein translocase subunit SecY [Roseimicrobium sp. ORNL1]